ncbi:MAG TPA: hypothetical protein DCZ69_10580 [Syntrophobacteraceae bacterium]|nr:hypothetical protein [Syntrophobacteraceae bacterium]HBZ54595.1 hypothetical protein [Syntrophobacteraceae bacterium]
MSQFVADVRPSVEVTKMKIATIMIAFSLACYVCTCAAATSSPASSVNLTEAQEVTEALRNTLQVKVPSHFMQKNPTKKGTELSMEEVLRVLNRLSMEPQWRPDYDYLFDGMGGYPVVYALGPNGTRDNLLSHVKTDGTTEGTTTNERIFPSFL